MAVDFTTLARVKKYLDIPTETTVNDATLQTMITSVSATLENALNRTVKTESKTERRACPMTGVFTIYNGPATSITSIRYSSSGMFSRDGVTLSSTSYELSPDGGSILIPDYRGPDGMLEVVYTGGMGTDTADLQAKYPVLDQAATLQVAYLWGRHKSLGRTSTDLGGGSTQWVGDYDLLDSVVAMLLPLRHQWAFA